MKIKILPFILFILICLMSPSAFSGNGFPGVFHHTGKIQHVATFTKGNDQPYYFTMEGFPELADECPNKANGQIIIALPSNHHGERIYSAILSAVMMDQNVTVGVDPKDKNSYGHCMIYSLHIWKLN